MFVFCKDHILRYKVWQYDFDKKVGRYLLLPFRSYEKKLDNAFFKKIRDDFEFQEGITVKDLFLNLEPWSDIMEGLTSMDFKAFCEEAKLTPEPDPDLDYVTIDALVRLSGVPEYEPFEGNSVMDFFFNRKPVVTDALDLEITWNSSVILKPSAVGDSGEDSVSCDYSPLYKWGHCPVRINADAEFRDESIMSNSLGFLSSSEPLINPNHPLVNKIIGTQDRIYGYSLKIKAAPNLYDTLIRGCFWEWGFHYSPVGRDQTREEIQDSLDEVSDMVGEDLDEATSENDEATTSSSEDDQPMSAMEKDKRFENAIYDEILREDPDCIIMEELATRRLRS